MTKKVIAVSLAAILSILVRAWPQPQRPPLGKGSEGGNVSPSGAEIQIDFPAGSQLKNRGGSDGLGLCVFASLDHAALWQNVEETRGIFQWMWDKPGGGWPEKVDRMIARKAAEAGTPPPKYYQLQTRDYSLIKQAVGSNRLVCCTYSYSPSGKRYGGSGRKIAHMVNLAHATDKEVAFLDNNYPGYEWTSPEEAIKVICGSGQGWLVIFENPGPPMPPKN